MDTKHQGAISEETSLAQDAVHSSQATDRFGRARDKSENGQSFLTLDGTIGQQNCGNSLTASRQPVTIQRPAYDQGRTETTPSDATTKQSGVAGFELTTA
ncbi:MAG TPA: hypothetical protein DDW52_20560 [Planctomycetaceae bacterium]|nr:hypothetical protein [Planctomycetaceae bacterium]